MRPASSGGSRGTSGTPSRQNMGIDPSVAIRRGEGAHRKWCRELWCFSRVRPVCRGILGLHQGCKVPFRTSRRNVGLLLRHCSGKGLHLAMTGKPRGFFSSCGGILELRWGIQASSSVGPGKSNLPFELRERAGDCSRVTSRQIDLI